MTCPRYSQFLLYLFQRPSLFGVMARESGWDEGERWIKLLEREENEEKLSRRRIDDIVSISRDRFGNQSSAVDWKDIG